MAKFCPECGTRLPIETAKFCHECGTSLSPLSSPPPDVVPPLEPGPVPQETPEPQVQEPVTQTYAEVEDTASDVQLSVNISELGKQLEEHVDEMFRGLGYRTQRNVRFGQNGPRPYTIDVVAQKDEELVAIECHNDPQPADVWEITLFSRKLQWMREDTEATWHGIFIAYGNFTPEAESVAQQHTIETWGRDVITERWIQYFSGQMGSPAETPPQESDLPIQDHMVECSSCRAMFHPEDTIQICQNCQLPVCPDCATECPICHNIVGKNHLHACESCGVTGCEKCIKTVGILRKTKSCRACFEKGNETIQRLKRREIDIFR
jgi:hypothetical protein